jgi:Bacterial PH domain
MRLVSPAETVTPASVNRYLLPQERSAITVRMHPAALTGHLVMAGAGLLAAMKLTSRSARPEIAWGAYLLFPLYFLYRGAAWPAMYLVVTNERMMLVRGVLTRTAAALPLQKVTGLALKRTVPGRLLGYGTLIVDCPGRRQVFRKVRYLPYPEQLYLEISNLLGREELDETAYPADGGEG